MLFNSIDFLIFFPIVVALYFVVPYHKRWACLLAASYYFYAAWKLEYLTLIIISTLVDYVAGIQMGKRTNQRERLPFLIASLFTNLGLLFGFKYFNFFNDSIRIVFNQFNIFYNVPAFEVLLPVGISFYTFQTLAYTIDVYRGKLKPEKHLGIFALYVAFFPQLVAGPIERAKNLLPQFYHKFNFSGNRVVSGLRLMLWGMFKKVVIADRLAIYVNEVYNNPSEYHGLPIIIATFFFAFQIYCDFSGYSDIAIGSARIMGYNIMTNFRQPYFSQSVAEFWQRWHISLSTWFRDYLYIPLGGNRVPKWRWYLNLMIVFVVSGLWHGANWTFIIWGALHGSYLLIEIWMKNIRAKISDLRYLERFSSGQTLLRTLTTFLLIVFAWMFFRAASIGEAFILIQNMFYINGFAGINVPWVLHVANPRFEMALSLGLLAFLQGIHFLQNCNLLKPMFYSQPRTVRWASYLLLALAIMNFGISEEIPFIYFQF